jgi:hypothetical protein
VILQSIISGYRNLFWIFFHFLLGLICTFTPYVLIIWFYLVLITSVNKALINLRNGRPFFYISLLTYLIGFEMLGRMAHAFPLIPTELSKYFIFIFSITGIYTSKIKNNTSWIILGLIISIGLLYDYSGKTVFSDLVNNYLGLFSIALGLYFLSGQNLSSILYVKILKLILLALIPALFFTYIKTPEFEDIAFELRANFATSGGAATNQVSTVFGLGFFISFYLLYKRIPFTGNKLLDIFIGIGFFAQGLLTFSRGGILVALISVLVLLMLNLRRISAQVVVFTVFGSGLLFFTFNYIDNFTGGKLALRYQGETEGTYKHGAVKTLNKITSGRATIFEEDLKLWFSHPVLGVGVGASRYLRGGGLEDTDVSSHIELSRILAEHGLFGMFFFIALLNLGLQLWKNCTIDKNRQIFFLLYLIALMTSFHSAMRTFVTPLLMALSSIGMYNVKNCVIHRRNQYIYKGYLDIINNQK